MRILGAALVVCLLVVPGVANTARGQGLEPRNLAKPPAVVVPEQASGRLIIKFRDEIRARPLADGRLRSQAGRDLTATSQVIKALGLRCRPAFKQAPDKLAGLQQKATAFSSRAQPDLAGMMYLEGDLPNLAAAANVLHQMPDVEFVSIEPVWELKGGPVGACCNLDDTCTDFVTEASCTAAGGTWLGAGTSCGASVSCGACCLPDPMGGQERPCVFTSEGVCTAQGGIYQGDQVTCGFQALCGTCCTQEGACLGNMFCEDLCVLGAGGDFLPANDCTDDDGDSLCAIECGVVIDENTDVGSCFDINGSRYCLDPDCCDLICSIDPYCCEASLFFPGRGAPTWDEWCVDHAELLCGPGSPDVLCSASSNEECFTAHESPGCSDGGCCQAVCAVVPLCCELTWSLECVQTALAICNPAMPGDETPSFRDAQGYLTPLSYVQEWGFTPPAIAPALPLNSPDNTEILDGYQGQGYDLQGLWEFAEWMVANGATFDGFDENLTRGRTMRVGVVEFAAYVPGAVGIHTPEHGPYGHEDLDVTVEPGETVLITGMGNLTGDHGTATLGIIGAVDHDADGNVEPEGLSPAESFAEEVGCVGIAPEAELWFFPIVSVEEPGGRFLSAMVAVAEEFSPGDVASFSFGPVGCGTLASDPAAWIMLRFLADLGITCCISAGNDSCNLDGIAQFFGDSDCIIVGACYPGRPTVDQGEWNSHCRLGFSNFCRGCGLDDRVHTGAWGAAVATLGYGGMFLPEGNPNRSYTNAFQGTSASAPMLAGLVACMQGFAKMFYGIPLLPGQIRQVVSSSGHFQCGYPDPDTMPGQDVAIFVGDFDHDQTTNLIGAGPPPGRGNVAFTNAVTAANTMIETPFFDDADAFISEIFVVRGEHIYGNRVSLQVAEGNVLVVESEYTLQGDNAADPDASFGLPFNAPLHVQDAINSIEYIANGEIVDLLILSEEGVTIPEFGAIEVAGGGGILMFVEAHAWDGSGWTYLAILPGGGGIAQMGSTDQISRFLHPDTNQLLVRIWTFGFGSANFSENDGPENPYLARFDLVRLITGQGFGVTPNGG